MPDLVDAGRKIREGRERIKQRAEDFDHRTAIVNNENGVDDKGKEIN
jgi:hypothetical protein